MPLSMFPKIKIKIYGVSSNIMDSIYSDYYLPSDYANYIKIVPSQHQKFLC